MDGLNFIIGFLVARPRPTSPPIHVLMPETVPSFPSGHVENDVVYYGFLLYLSFSKPVSQWRYRWLLIPFQLYFALNILFIGYSRVLEGSHWLNDALAGYLTGALWLALLIFLYRWTLDRMTKWYARRSALTTQEPQPSTDTIHAKTLDKVQVVEKKMKPYEELFIKCRDDWIHHLAQALAYSFLTTLVSIAIILLPIYSAILGRMDTPMQHLFSVRLEALFPPPLSSQVTQVFGKALDVFSHASPIAKLATFLLAALLGSFLFSLMESCFDVIYHLPPRPFLRRHLVALGMLFLFIALTPIIILAATAPTLILSLAHVFPPGSIPESNLIYQLASIVGSILLSLILFQAIYVLVPSRHIRIQTVGRHIRNSWQGTLVATGALQLGLLLFHFYTTSSLSYYIGDLGFIIITLLYFWLFALILLFGAEINAFFAEGIRVPQNDLITQASKDGYR
jgi:membrane protein